jgi:hypothetical protein
MVGERAIFRVIGGLPASIDFGLKGVWFLTAIDQDYPPYSFIRLAGPKKRHTWDFHCIGKGHAEHVLLHGMEVDVLSTYFRFFVELVRAGKAEVVCGPHCGIYWMSQSNVGPSQQFNALYTWRDPNQNPNFNL